MGEAAFPPDESEKGAAALPSREEDTHGNRRRPGGTMAESAHP